jgi:CheY-like chemotaxis protein
MSFHPATRRSPQIEADWLTLGQACTLPRRRAVDDPEVVRPGPRPGLLHPGRPPGAGGAFPRGVRRTVRPGTARRGPRSSWSSTRHPLRELLRLSLERAGPSVRQAENVTAALAAIDEQAPELVLLDAVVPGADGWALLQRLEGGTVRFVIMYSGQGDEGIVGEAAERGAGGFVGKPFDPDELVGRAMQLVPA